MTDLLMSMPNAGSQWFATCVAKADQHIYFTPTHESGLKEFFNPITNWESEFTLAGEFGSELAGNYRLIAASATRNFGIVLGNTWAKTHLTFTKEVYCPYKLPAFKAFGFDCKILLRSWEASFPPKRMRMVAWYDSVFYSMLEHKRFDPFTDFANQLRTCRERAAFAHAFLENDLRRMASELEIPITEWEVLVQGSEQEVMDHLNSTGYSTNVMDEVLLTRLPMERDHSHDHQWGPANEMHARAQEMAHGR